MKYPPQILEQIKARISLVDEVRRSVPTLKKKGKYWWANCPFHNEKSPSFHVREEGTGTGNYYCFGCGASGDLFTFVMETQGTDFNSTIKSLAARAGVRLPEPERIADPAAQSRRDQGYQALASAARFWQSCLPGPAQSYLQNRAITDETVKEFGLGYSPDQWSATRDELTQQGFGLPVLLETGLAIESEKKDGKESRSYDRFRGRLMFPIHDLQGRVVAFGGRILKPKAEDEKQGPKYLNSPETPFFSKSFLLYNLHRARPEMRLKKQALLVEGYMDVIALWQAGLKTAVAPLGTSVTEDQLLLLWQQVDKPTVCLDGDAAGRTAALRVAQKVLPILEPGRSIQFVWMPEGEDPDSLIKKDGLSAFHTLLSEPTSLEDVLWQQLTAGHDLSHADSRASVENALSALLNTIRNATVRRAYAQTLRERLWQASRGTTRRSAGQGSGASIANAPSAYRPSLVGDTTARVLLAVVLRWPAILPEVIETLAGLSFPPGEQADLCTALIRGFSGGQEPSMLVTSLSEGLFTATMADLMRTTGVENLPEETPPLRYFSELFKEYQSRSEQKRLKSSYSKNIGNMFSLEEWEKYKQIQSHDKTS